MWMIWESGTKSPHEIGELFGGLNYAVVAQRIRRTRLSHDANAARKLKAKMLNVFWACCPNRLVSKKKSTQGGLGMLRECSHHDGTAKERAAAL